MKTKSLTIKTLMYSDHISPPSSFIELGRNLNICQDCRCCVQEIKEIYNKSKSNK